MSKFSKVFDLTKEKNANKVYAALDNGRGRELLNSFLSEAQSATAKDLERAQLTITNSYVCSYQEFKRQLFIIPLEDIVNVYISNSFYGTYNYDFKAIAIETRNNETFYFAKHGRAQHPDAVRTAFAELVNRCKSNEGSLIA